MNSHPFCSHARKRSASLIAQFIAIESIVLILATALAPDRAQAGSYKGKITCGALVDMAKAGGSIELGVSELVELCSSQGIDDLAKAVGDHQSATTLTLHNNPDNLLRPSLMISVSKSARGKVKFVFD